MTVRPTLLFVSPRFLLPADEGGKIRTSNILRGLHGGLFRVVLATPAPADIAPFRKDIDAICDRIVSWRQTPVSRLRRVLALAVRRPVSVATDASTEGSRVIAAALQERPDVVVVDFPHAAVLMPPRIDAASVMFTHNIETEILERHAAKTSGWRRRIWRDQARKMERFESVVLRRFDKVIAVSARDGAALRARFALNAVEQIDTGVDLDFFHPSRMSAPPPLGDTDGTIVFTGVMGSPANSDGVTFLADEVWPLVTRARPDAKAIIVGRNPPPGLVAAVRKRGLAWTFTGYVDDVRVHVGAAHLAVIPLRVGSGTRIKAFEAMAMGRPVVSTRIGVEGLDVEDGKDLLMADDPASFADAIVRLLGDPGLRAQLVGNARALLESRFSWSHVAKQFEAICERAMTQNPVKASRTGE